EQTLTEQRAGTEQGSRRPDEAQARPCGVPIRRRGAEDEQTQSEGTGNDEGPRVCPRRPPPGVVLVPQDRARDDDRRSDQREPFLLGALQGNRRGERDDSAEDHDGWPVVRDPEV